MLPGFKFKGRHCSEFGIIMRSRRPILSATRQQYEEVPGQHGSHDFSDDTIEDRFEELDCGFVENNLNELRSRLRQIASWLYGKGELVYDDEPDKTYIGRVVNQVDLETTAILKRFTLQFRFEPFAYGKLKQSVYSITSSTTVTVNVGGTASTPPRIMVTNKGDNVIPTLTLTIDKEID